MDPSATLYTSFFLALYDPWVLWLSNTFAWRCSTTHVLLPFFQRHIGANAHLDVGVGTGFYPAKSVRELSKTTQVCFLDLNPNTLTMASERLAKAGYEGKVDTVEHDVFKPLPTSLHGKFDAVSIFYLLHCLSGGCTEKAERVFASLVPALAPDGILYGSTVLGKGVPHNLAARLLMRVYNSRGAFGNVDDTEEGFSLALRRHFEEVETKDVGAIMIFTARRPKRRCKCVLYWYLEYTRSCPWP